jgi:hypothetical protein
MFVVTLGHGRPFAMPRRVDDHWGWNVPSVIICPNGPIAACSTELPWIRTLLTADGMSQLTCDRSPQGVVLLDSGLIVCGRSHARPERLRCFADLMVLDDIAIDHVLFAGDAADERKNGDEEDRAKMVALFMVELSF